MTEEWTTPTRKGPWSGRSKEEIVRSIKRYKDRGGDIQFRTEEQARDWLDYVEQNSVPAEFLSMVRRDYILSVAGGAKNNG